MKTASILVTLSFLLNDLFDMLKSKSKVGKCTKQPIDSNNCNDIENSLCEAISFLMSFTDTNDVPLFQGQLKDFVIGFCVSANYILAISRYLLERLESPFECILPYRFSQGAIEMFFSKADLGGTTIHQHFNSNML